MTAPQKGTLGPREVGRNAVSQLALAEWGSGQRFGLSWGFVGEKKRGRRSSLRSPAVGVHLTTVPSKACFSLKHQPGPAPALSQRWETSVLPPGRLGYEMEREAVRDTRGRVLNLRPDTL